jgi:hypothetical protein
MAHIAVRLGTGGRCQSSKMQFPRRERHLHNKPKTVVVSRPACRAFGIGGAR